MTASVVAAIFARLTRGFIRPEFAPVIPPQVLRKQLHMTQPEFAKALRIPLATLSDVFHCAANDCHNLRSFLFANLAEMR
jgi:hypothetical protein